jgi:hypothetical protein
MGGIKKQMVPMNSLPNLLNLLNQNLRIFNFFTFDFYLLLFFFELRFSFAWISDYRTTSVTELEIRHGFLHHPHQSEGHSFFFFRDPSYLDQLDDDNKTRYENCKVGKEKKRNRDEESKQIKFHSFLLKQISRRISICHKETC